MSELLRRTNPFGRRRSAIRPAAAAMLALIAMRLLTDGATLAMGSGGDEAPSKPAPAWTVFAEHAGHDCGHCVPECFEGDGHRCMETEARPSEFGLIRFGPLCGGASDRSDRAVAEASAGKFLPPARPVLASLPPPAPQAARPDLPQSFHPSIDTPPPEA